ncbi:MAG TPA: anthranilate phosphoribosyltransferase, partial [Rhizomicrobium sp.]|nr:anthranilate phosphoribosyltransferase [Rhizomicrobium sp.]
MSAPRELLKLLTERRNLTEAQAGELLAHLTDAELPPPLAGALIAALATKGVVADEVRGLARTMRRLARRPDIPSDLRAIDIVGTGGDASGSFNISTGTALLTAACGLPVVKHGNRSVSSRCGSADVLEALGVRVDLSPQQAGACLAETGLCFLFAPLYHPAMKHIAPVRKDLGFRTVFNLLGPLSNPARVPRQLLGVFAERWVEPMAGVLAELGTKRAWVVHGSDGMDELTITGPSVVVEVFDGKKCKFEIEPGRIGLGRATLDSVKGGDATYNAGELDELLKGRGNEAYRDIVILNSAAALTVSGKAETIEEGAEIARRALHDGRARAKLEELRRATQGFAA